MSGNLDFVEYVFLLFLFVFRDHFVNVLVLKAERKISMSMKLDIALNWINHSENIQSINNAF